MPSADEVIAAYQKELGRAPDAGEIASELDNAARYGDDWFNGQFITNLQERDAPTASAGGSGGDIDLDGNGVVDNGWYLVDSADTGNPGWIQEADLGKLSGNQHVFDVGGDPASAVVAAFFESEQKYNAAQEAVRLEIDRANLTGAFDGPGGSSAAGIAAARASTGAAIFNAQGSFLGGLLGYRSDTIASSPRPGVFTAAAGGTKGRSILPAPSSAAVRWPNVSTASGGAPGTAVATSYRDPTRTAGVTIAATGGGAAPMAAGVNPQNMGGLLMVLGLGFAAWYLTR